MLDAATKLKFLHICLEVQPYSGAAESTIRTNWKGKIQDGAIEAKVFIFRLAGVIATKFRW